MTHPTEPARDAFEYPEGIGTLGQDQAVLDDPDSPAFDFEVVKDEKTSIYEAIVGGRQIAGLPYNVTGGRLVLLATSVLPEFRKHGVATELIRRVLDDVRAQGKTVTPMCPIVRIFIERNPEYADLIDPDHPGGAKGLPRQES